MAELAVKYKLDAHGLLLKDLVTERDFLAQRLDIPEHLLQGMSWGDGCIVITYWIVRDVLPLAELALCREGVRAELTQHGVEEVYLDSHPSEHLGPVSSREWLYLVLCGIPWHLFLLQCRWTNHCRLYIVRKPRSTSVMCACMIQSYACVSLVLCCTLELCKCTCHSYLLYVFVYVVQRRAIVTVLDAHRQDLDAISLTSDLKGMGILTAEQCQKLASLDDGERRHEALLYILLAHNGPDAYHKLVECMGSRDASIAADLQGMLDQVKCNVVAKLQIV